jgi:hypothetical protein
VIWGLLLRPGFYKAVARDTGAAIATAVLGPCCAVTGEHVYPRNRAEHEHDHHFGEGACA